MAGLPSSVVTRSEDLMRRMQRDFSKNLSNGKKQIEENVPQAETPQLNLF